jgi:hypothetical protein
MLLENFNISANNLISVEAAEILSVCGKIEGRGSNTPRKLENCADC